MKKGLISLVIMALIPVWGAAGSGTWCLERRIVCERRAPAGGRVALVIGNSAYDNAPIQNPVNDAVDMAAALRELGFDVMLQTDADLRTMIEAVNEFGRRLAGSAIGFFYFSGHGIQLRGENYLVPVGATIHSESDIPFEAMKVGRVLAKIDAAEGGINIVILDACRDNPFRRSFRTEAMGLAKMDAPAGTIIGYSTSPGSIASDGEGRNGVYTKHLLEMIRKPGLSVQDMLMETGLAVMRETHQAQIPWISSTPIPRVYLAGRAAPLLEEKKADESPAVAEPHLTPTKGFLKVETDPPGAQIYVDDMEQGSSPLVIAGVSPGTVQVRAEREGYKGVTRTVRITPAATVRLYCVLEPESRRPRLYVEVTPGDAEVRILNLDNPYRPDMELDPGEYRLQVTKNGYKAWVGAVEIAGTERRVVKVKLEHKPRRPPGQVWVEPVTGMKFAWVPPGCYQMGCGDWSRDCDEDEKPVHDVCVSGFWIGCTEVTQRQWKQVMGGNPAHFQRGGGCPVENVSWNDARRFIERLTSLVGGRYEFRLPTEAQWEYACRSGGKKELYAGGEDLDELGWYYGNTGLSGTREKAAKKPNGLGLYDMSGNVWEWCRDGYDKEFYAASPHRDPVNDMVGSGCRVLRGGSWGLPKKYLRCTERVKNRPDVARFNYGLRVARTDYEGGGGVP